MSGETLLGLAAVLEVEIGDLTGGQDGGEQARPAWLRCAGPGFGRGNIRATTILSLPAFMFARSNIGAYELGLEWARWLFPFEWQKDAKALRPIEPPVAIVVPPRSFAISES